VVSPDPPGTLSRLRETVALWYVDRSSAADIVHAACEALVADLGGLSLAELAAVPVATAEQEVPPLLEAALDEVGLDHHLKGSRAGEDAGLLVMASQVLAGGLAPGALVSWACAHCGQDVPDLARGLVPLGDRYDGAVGDDLDLLDDEVRAEARRILACGASTDDRRAAG
jgi:hypothetical protein